MNTVLSDYRFLTTQPGFTARGLLNALHSPRLQDLPDLASWIDAAADASGISRELLCCVAQKEQSALTKPYLNTWALNAFCGFGVPAPGHWPKPAWRGPEAQLRAAAQGLRILFDLAERAGPNPWYAQVGQHFAPGGEYLCTPTNRATAALYSYTPSVSDKHALLAIWQEFNFGDPLAGPPVSGGTAMATNADVARIAQQVCEAHAAGKTSFTIGQVTWDMRQTGRCAQFVRECHEAALGIAEYTWPYRAPSAACMEAALRHADKRVGEPQPGDIVLVNQAVPREHLDDWAWQQAHNIYGHVCLYLGDGRIAENTSRRGLGTVVSPIAVVSDRITFYARALPSALRQATLTISGHGQIDRLTECMMVPPGASAVLLRDLERIGVLVNVDRSDPTGYVKADVG